MRRAKEYVAAGDIEAEGVHMLSTSGMLRHVEEHPDGSFIVATGPATQLTINTQPAGAE